MAGYSEVAPPSLSVTCVHEKRFIDPKIGISEMKRVIFSSLWIAFHCNMPYMTYWGPIKEWFSFESSLSNSTAPKTSRQTTPLSKSAQTRWKRWKQNFFAHAQTLCFLLLEQRVNYIYVRSPRWYSVQLFGTLIPENYWLAKQRVLLFNVLDIVGLGFDWDKLC